MSAIITNAGAALFAAKIGASQPIVITGFLLANINGLNVSGDPDRAQVLPAVGNRVHSQNVYQTGYLTPDSVVYSLLLSGAEGGFTFNWMGLLADDNTLVAVSHFEPVTKTVNIGENLVRNIVVQYSGISGGTNITVAAESWQLDFTAAIAQVDADLRILIAGNDASVRSYVDAANTAQDDNLDVVASGLQGSINTLNTNLTTYIDAENGVQNNQIDNNFSSHALNAVGFTSRLKMLDAMYEELFKKTFSLVTFEGAFVVRSDNVGPPYYVPSNLLGVPSAAIVAGLRVEINPGPPHVLTVPSVPTHIWLEVWYDHNTGETDFDIFSENVASKPHVVVDVEVPHFFGTAIIPTKHYFVELAHIDAAHNITDKTSAHQHRLTTGASVMEEIDGLHP